MNGNARLPDRLLAAGLLGAAALVVWMALALDVPFAADPVGPRAFPIAVALVLAAAAGLIAWRPAARWERAERVLPGIAVTAAMVAYALVMPMIGFLAATVLLCAVIARAFDARPLAALVVGVVTAPLLWLLLDRLLDLPLPRGTLWP